MQSSPAALRKPAFWPWLIPIVALLATATYIAVAEAQGFYGFPLDDAWIHQTYARNLAETGQLAYLPGQPSAGSTSPAWSFLLSVSYLVGIDDRLWGYLLGGLALAATAWLTGRLFLRLQALRPAAAGRPRGTAPVLAGLFCAVEWHLVWAAASGMETMLFTALSLALLEYYFSQVATVGRHAAGEQQGPASLRTERTYVNAVGIGLLAGLLAITRPEGLGLAGLVIGALLVSPLPADRSELKTRLLATGASLLALGAILAPYVAFNLRTAGSLFPNTFYAKQAEYQIYLRALPPLARFWRVLSPSLVGAQVLLLPGFGYAIYRLVRSRQGTTERSSRARLERLAAALPPVLPLVWWLGILLVYAWRLPVDYQHGRYAMPSIPLLILYGAWGTAELLRPRSPHRWKRVLSRGMPVAMALLALLFWGRGALAYRDDVGFIEGEMVAVARWLDEHTTPGDRIAVHDIGAVGYLTDRPLLDLAGLITPQVIPFITDAQQLVDWMAEQGATYVVFFPDFSPTYSQLAADPRLHAVYCTDYAWTRAQGHQNLCAFRLSAGK
jgi:arabinofuranosyltransferase